MKYIVRSVDGDEYGPFSREELQNLVSEERLGPGDFIRREAGRTWSPFEKIAGLGEGIELVTEEPPTTSARTATAGIAKTAEPSKTAPIRPTVGAEVVEKSRSNKDDEVQSSERGETSIAEDDSGEDRVSAREAEDRATQDRLSGTADPNTFLSLGLPITLGVEEEVHFTAVQSFTDALRESTFNAILGHRGRLVCTSRRIVTVRPSVFRPSMQIAWVESTSMAAIQTRRNLFRMVVGVVLVFYAISTAIMSGLTSGIMAGTGLGGPFLTLAGTAGLVVASVIGLLGLLGILTANRRAMVISSSGSEIVFGCMAIGPWHLAQIDAARLSSPIAASAGDRITPPTSLDED